MSYCRFSSDNWKSDVYVYEDVGGGWTTHVAMRRRKIQPIPDILCSRFAGRVHEWSGCNMNPETLEFTYPNIFKKYVYRAWISVVVFWHKWIHGGTLHLIPLHPIGLAFDGESFSDGTALECAKRLEWLRAMGYHVPQKAIDALRSEESETE